MNNKTTKVLHVFPLIGGGVIGVEFLKFKGLDIENINKGFSLSGAKTNEQILMNNRPIDIEYWDEKYADIECNCITCNSELMDYNEECKKVEKCIEDNKDIIDEADIILSIPPCNSLSLLNCSMESRSGKGNPASQIMIRCCEFALKSNVECFIFENAPGLSTAKGFPLLEQIGDMLKNYPDYSMNVVKTSSVYHGMAQKRERTFVYLWRSEHAPILDFEVDLSPIESVIGDIDATGKEYCSKPQTEQQKFFRVTKTSLEDNYTLTSDDYYLRWKLINELLDKPDISGYIGKKIRNIEDIDKWFKEKFYKTDWCGDMSKEEKFIRHIHMKMSKGMGYWGREPLPTFYNNPGIKCTTAITAKSMGRFIHPEFKRCLTFREECRLMGIPDSFEVDKKVRFKITQNVPSLTFAAMTEQYHKDLVTSPYKYIFQIIKKDGVVTYYGNTIQEVMSKKKTNLIRQYDIINL